MQKPPPVYDADLVTHPEHDALYVHFEGAADHPFRADPPASAGVPRVNAWWLAEAALASYWDAADAAALYAAAGLQSEKLTAGSTDAYVIWAGDWLVVAFRGTEPDDWRDLLTDAALALVPWQTGRTHHGFTHALDEVWPAMTATLAQLAPGRAVWFTGHSLGAALATLAADRYAGTRGVCTFGSPRVGDQAFARAFTHKFRGRMLRFVNNQDIVTHVPLPPLYKHIDLRRFIAPDGTISRRRSAVPHFFEGLVGQPTQLANLMVAATDDAAAFAPRFLLDHMPKAYAIWAWNDYAANG